MKGRLAIAWAVIAVLVFLEQRRLKRWANPCHLGSQGHLRFTNSVPVLETRRSWYFLTVSNLAARLDVKSVYYDDSVRSYFTSFPWFQFAAFLQIKLDEYGIELIERAKAEEEAEEVLERLRNERTIGVGATAEPTGQRPQPAIL